VKTRLLDIAEFKATFADPMSDVLRSATNVIDVWPYAAAIPAADLLGHKIVDGVVECVYRNGTNTFDHVLVPTQTKNTYLAIVVDLQRDTVFGHHLLDLNDEYGLITRH
jgi:hypothetical protein